MWHLLHVMHLPLVVSCIMYDLLWWLWSSMPTIVPWVHSLLSSCWTATADPMGIHGNIAEASFVLFSCLSTRLLWWSSAQSLIKGLQSNTGMMPWTCLPNINDARVSKPWLNSIVWIWRRAMFMSLPESVQFYVHFMNFIQVLICLLLWWWYADDITYSILIELQNCQNLSATKLVPMSDIIFQGIPYLANIIFTILIRFSADRPSNLLMNVNLLL